MAKKFDAALDEFLDRNGQLMAASLKSDSPDQFNRFMDKVLEEFLSLPLPQERKARTATPKRKVRRGIGSY